MNAGPKTAIILIGRGMSSAHGSGFLYALATELGITHPAIMIGSSGDAANVAYFCAGQWEENRYLVLNLLSTPKFISWLRPSRVMDIDYLVDTVYKRQAALDAAKVMASPIVWRIPIRGADTGELRYVGATDGLDLFEVLRAAKAIPFLYRKKVLIGGKRYIDGQYRTTVAEHIAEARELGAERIVIVSHHKDSPAIEDPDVLLISPAAGLPAHVATRNNLKLRGTFACGVEDALKHKEELRRLLT